MILPASLKMKNPSAAKLLLFLLLAGSCDSLPSGKNSAKSVYEPVAITPEVCAEIHVNGGWELVNIRTEGKNHKPDKPVRLTISECTFAKHVYEDASQHTDTFSLFRVIEFCADYQLVYKNDSIACINFRKDTMVVGACNNYEETRYYYKRIRL
jgi:hypothetical protein